MSKNQPIQTSQHQLLQLEITSHCNLQCITCLRGNFPTRWVQRQLTPQLFNKILPQLQGLTNVHLQGWGEPLLHPNIFSFIKSLKSQNHSVSFTTNGTIMNEKIAEVIIGSKLDGITFSMAGGTEKTQDTLRGKGSFQKATQSIETITRFKKNCATVYPKIAISYLLTPQTIKELPRVIRWCKKKGINQLSTVHLTQATCSKQEPLQFLSSKMSLKQKLNRFWLNLIAFSPSFTFKLKQFTPTELPVCDKNPINNFFIAANGTVSPCVFLNPPMHNNLNWSKNGDSCPQPPTIFGDLQNTSLKQILLDKEFSDFRMRYKSRKAFYEQALSQVTYSMSGLEQLEVAKSEIAEMFMNNPPPIPCKHCHKIDGF